MDYAYLIIPIIVLIATQALKLLTDGIKGNFDIRNLFSMYGGMPSSHTAFAVSITAIIGLRLGFEAPLFAVCLVFTLLIMRDAIAFRNLVGKQSVALNLLAKQLPEGERKELPQLRERMGHTALEVGIGAIWSFVLTYLLHIINWL